MRCSVCGVEPRFLTENGGAILRHAVVKYGDAAVFSDQVVMSIGLLGDIWYGFMFETWFRNQLVANGYQQTA